MGMTKEEAKAYLARKDVKETKAEIDNVMKKGKIYGDPVVELE